MTTFNLMTNYTQHDFADTYGMTGLQLHPNDPVITYS
jgi:hypothetical protein